MTNNLSKIFLGIAVCAASTVAIANGSNFQSTPSSSFAKQGFIIGVDGGYGHLSTPEAAYPNDQTYTDDVTNITYKDTSDSDIGDWVWGAHIGYDFKVRPDMLIGLEAGYKDLGSSKISANSSATDEDGNLLTSVDFSRKYEQNAVDILLTMHYYIYHGFNIFGKAGIAYVRSEIDQSQSAYISRIDSVTVNDLNTGDNDIWRLEPEASLGIGYTFSCGVDVHAAYTYVGGADDQPYTDSYDNLPKAKVYSTNMATLGVSYTFAL